MTSEEKWQLMYDRVNAFMFTNRRRPSRHRAEERRMVYWMRFNRRRMAAGTMLPQRVPRFKQLMLMAIELRRVNQYAYVTNVEGQQLMLDL